MPLVNPRGAGLSAPVLVGLPQKETCVEKATRARGAWLQLRGDVHIRGSTPWEKSAIHLIMIFLCALSCIRAIVNA